MAAHPTPRTDPIAPSDERPTVTVVGGGIAGLVASLAAQRAGATVVLLEPHPLGGRARTDQRGDYTFNRGPRALYHRGPAEAALRSFGLEVGTGGDPITTRALAIAGGRAHRLPIGPVAATTTTLLSAGQKLTAARHLLPLLRGTTVADAELTLATWLDQRGTTGTLRGLFEALVRVATYVDAPDQLSAADAIAQGHAGATTGVRYLDGGFGSVVAGLRAAADVAGVERRSVAARAVGHEGGRWRVGTAEGPVDGDAVVLAVGGPAAATRLLGGEPTGWSPLGPPARAACLELGVRRVPRHRFALGIDEPTYLSVHAPPADLAPPGHAVVHVMRYRRHDDDLDPRATEAQLRALAAMAGIDPADIVEARYLDAMEVTGAIPLAANGGLAGRPRVAVPGPAGAFVAGDWVGPEGMLLDAAVASGVAAGQQAVASCATMAAS